MTRHERTRSALCAPSFTRNSLGFRSVRRPNVRRPPLVTPTPVSFQTLLRRLPPEEARTGPVKLRLRAAPVTPDTSDSELSDESESTASSVESRLSTPPPRGPSFLPQEDVYDEGDTEELIGMHPFISLLSDGWLNSR